MTGETSSHGSVLPLHLETADVTLHDGHVYLRAGFSEIQIKHADALVLAGDLLEACGYTYQIQHIDQATEIGQVAS